MLTRRGFVAASLLVPAFARPAAAEPPRIRDVARANGFRFGAAVALSDMEGPLRPLLDRECDVVTPENAMKMKEAWPRPDREDFRAADELVGWARSFGAVVRAHALVFTGRGMPAWLDELAVSHPGKAVERTLRYVEDLATRCRAEVTSIDVVNEAIRPDDRRPHSLHDHWLYNHAGVGVVADAFAIARDAAPGVELVYNDWVLPYPDAAHAARRSALLELLEECLRRNAPIDAVGIQSHLTHRAGRQFDAHIWRSFLGQIEAMGLRVAVTELTANDCGLAGDVEYRDAEMGWAVEEYLSVTLDATSVRDVVCWGISDARTHFAHDETVQSQCNAHGETRPVRALPYDDQLAMKPMATAIMSAMRAAPDRS